MNFVKLINICSQYLIDSASRSIYRSSANNFSRGYLPFVFRAIVRYHVTIKHVGDRLNFLSTTPVSS